ncbi:MAG: transporter permease, partial [Rhodococcus erythropolis]|nr:transporter permease [Rhodococcus erythropolis]
MVVTADVGPRAMTAVDVRPDAGPTRGHRDNSRRKAILTMVGRRVLFIVPVIAVVSAGLFAAAAISPFDPLVGYLGTRYMTTSDADKALIADQMGFDNPWYSTYWNWLQGV